jgi:CDP-paratose 2-epimerase
MSRRESFRDKVGICQWFHYEAHADLDRAAELLHDLDIRHFRTGVSWADFHRPRGQQWYRRQMEALRGFDVLLSVWHTPPSISEGGTCASPPRRLDDYADFIRQLIDEYGDLFSHFELWNEPNNRLKWDFERYDPDWSKFGAMIREAGRVARDAGKTSVLGGMIPVDHHWLGLMRGYGVLEAVDAAAIHGFPDMWWDDHPNWDWYRYWKGWPDKLDYAAAHAEGKPVWVTETGLATYDLHTRARARHELQRQRLLDAAEAPADRVYWYSLIDLDPRRAAIEGFHVDENEYHLGVVTYDGSPKPAYGALKELLAEPSAAPAAGGVPGGDGESHAAGQRAGC